MPVFSEIIIKMSVDYTQHPKSKAKTFQDAIKKHTATFADIETADEYIAVRDTFEEKMFKQLHPDIPKTDPCSYYRFSEDQTISVVLTKQPLSAKAVIQPRPWPEEMRNADGITSGWLSLLIPREKVIWMLTQDNPDHYKRADSWLEIRITSLVVGTSLYNMHKAIEKADGKTPEQAGRANNSYLDDHFLYQYMYESDIEEFPFAIHMRFPLKWMRRVRALYETLYHFPPINDSAAAKFRKEEQMDELCGLIKRGMDGIFVAAGKSIRDAFQKYVGASASAASSSSSSSSSAASAASFISPPPPQKPKSTTSARKRRISELSKELQKVEKEEETPIQHIPSSSSSASMPSGLTAGDELALEFANEKKKQKKEEVSWEGQVSTTLIRVKGEILKLEGLLHQKFSE